MTGNGRVLVLCASRDRNIALQRMIDSVKATSTKADVAIYVDDDQAKDYAHTSGIFVGPRIGPVASLNYLWELHPGYEAYGAATDDSEFLTPGWDDWVLNCSAWFDRHIGVMAPHSQPAIRDWSKNPSRSRMDFPWVTAKFAEAAGWFAYPEAKHFYWDVVLEVIGHRTAISYATPEQFSMGHDNIATDDVHNKILRDAVLCIQGIAFDVPDIVQRVKAAIAG